MTRPAPTARSSARRRPAMRSLALRLGSALVALGCVLALPGTSYGVTYAQIEGTGSTWSELIVQQWISDVDSNGMKVTYTGGGSSKGRKDFAQSTVDFAISEIPYQGKDEQGQADTSNGRDFAYLPIVAGGTAFTYQVKVGNQLVRNLRLSGDTIAKIFTNKITNWNDPAITKDNNGRKLPSLQITPVVRSDGSGTTAQLTTWLDSEYPSIWRPFFGKSGLTSYYPKKGRTIGQAGSDQVMNYVSGFAGNGSIGYVEYSYPVNKDYPVVKVLNKGGYYVEPTQYNTAVALTQAKINKSDLTQNLTGVYRSGDARAYPLSSYSYMIIPTGKSDRRMSTAKRQTLADFLYYSLCQGQSKAGPYGYSPLPLNLVQAGFDQIAKLKKADPKVDLTDRDVKSCNNPTFDGKNPGSNKLAKIAPMPAACDKVGAGPCGTATGQNAQSPTSSGGDDKGTGTGPGTTGTGTGTTPGTTTGTAPGTDGAPTTATGDTPLVDADGVPVAATGTAGDAAVFANPTELSAARAGDKMPFGWLAVVELLALVLVPGLYVTWLRRRKAGAAGGAL